MRRYLLYTSIVLLALGNFVSTNVTGQPKKVSAACIAFYNLENLFDTIPSPNDKEFTPQGTYKWDSKKYYIKLHNMAQVISQIGDDYVKGGPVILGVSEIENRSVLEDLIRTSPIDKTGYQIVQYESPDRRGIDVGFIYQPQRFKVITSKPVPLTVASKPGWTTRDILVVEGLLDGDTLFVLVNHWPSRSGGERETAPLRQAAADLCYSTSQSIFKDHPNAKIVIMGDLNDDPVDESLMKHLRVKTRIDKISAGDLFDPMWQMYKDGNGTLAYKDAWNLFDQIIVSSALANKSAQGYHYYKALIFKKNFMVTQEGRYQGYPFRTFGDGVFQAGYSDHFPVYILLVKEKE